MSVVAMVKTEQPDITADFDSFWLLYPKRVAKKEAQRMWVRLNDAQQLAAIVGLAAWRRVWIARGEMQFVPNASTWINGERWEDELPVDVVSIHASHKPADVRTSERGEMPQHVKDLIAKLRAKQ